MKFILKQVQNILFWTEDWEAIAILEAVKGLF